MVQKAFLSQQISILKIINTKKEKSPPIFYSQQISAIIIQKNFKDLKMYLQYCNRSYQRKNCPQITWIMINYHNWCSHLIFRNRLKIALLTIRTPSRFRELRKTLFFNYRQAKEVLLKCMEIKTIFGKSIKGNF